LGPQVRRVIQDFQEQEQAVIRGTRASLARLLAQATADSRAARDIAVLQERVAIRGIQESQGSRDSQVRVVRRGQRGQRAPVASRVFQELVLLGFLGLVEGRATRATQERRDIQGSAVPVVSRDSLALVADNPAFQVSQDIQVSAVLQVFQGIRVLLESLDTQGSVARQGLMGRQTSLGFRGQGFLVSQASRVIQDSRGRVVILVTRDFQGRRAIVDSRGQAVIADSLGRPVIRVSRVLVGTPVLQV